VQLTRSSPGRTLGKRLPKPLVQLLTTHTPTHDNSAAGPLFLTDSEAATPHRTPQRTCRHRNHSAQPYLWRTTLGGCEKLAPR